MIMALAKAMFASEFAQDVLFGFTDAAFVFLEAVLDVGDAVNHDLPGTERRVCP